MLYSRSVDETGGLDVKDPTCFTDMSGLCAPRKFLVDFWTGTSQGVRGWM